LPGLGSCGDGVGVSYRPQAVDVSVFQAVPGDIDFDRYVNFSDVWTLLTTGLYNSADPYAKDSAPYAKARPASAANSPFGYAIPGGPGVNHAHTVVPEPGTLMILISGTMAFLLVSRRRPATTVRQPPRRLACRCRSWTCR